MNTRNATVLVVLPLVAVFGSAAFGQISASQADGVLAQQSSIAVKTAKLMKKEHDERKGKAFNPDADDLLAIVTRDPSSWQFYSRDRGILIAIDAPRRLSLGVYAAGRERVAEAAERVILQEQGIPITDRVTVIFMEPARDDCHERAARLAAARFSLLSDSAIVSGGSVVPAFSGMGSSSFGDHQRESCSCR